jgi:hypothetical protein
MVLSEKSMTTLTNWLWRREDDIAIGVEDLGELKLIFQELFGREPQERIDGYHK